MQLELPIASFVCAFLVLVPLPWHWRAANLATIFISFWLFIGNIISGVNTIIWMENVNIVAPVWCDIATKLMVGSSLALPACIFCLCIHLERVSSVRQVQSTHRDKRRRQIFDVILCIGLPIVYMAVRHRFDIIEDFGCRPNVYVSIPAIFLFWVPQLFFSVGALIVAGLALRNFYMRRITFARHLQMASSALTPARYFRLMAMAIVQMFWGLAITAFNMWFTLKDGLRPWIDWDDVHYDFLRVGLFPRLFIPKQEWTYNYVLWWCILPVSSFLFFVFFAFGQDAMREYRTYFTWIRRKVFRIPDKAPSAKKGVPPLHNEQKLISLPKLSLATTSEPQSPLSEDTKVCSSPSYRKPPPRYSTSSCDTATPSDYHEPLPSSCPSESSFVTRH